jgi:hypothetical protein
MSRLIDDNANRIDTILLNPSFTLVFSLLSIFL